MKKLLVISIALALVACGERFETLETQTNATPPAQGMPTINLEVHIGAPVSNIVIDNSNTGGNTTANGGNSSATGGNASNSNSNTSTNNNNNNSQVQEQEVELNVRAGIYLDDEESDDSDKDHKDKKKKKNKNKYAAGLKCKVYDLNATKPSKLPDYSTMSHIELIGVDRLDVTNQNYAAGFPKFPSALRSHLLEWYGLRCTGYFVAPKADTYTFFLTSDDGSKMSLNGNAFIDNDNLHSVQTKQNSSYLKKGRHPIVIDYFQGPRTEISLVLEMQATGVARQIVPTANLNFKK